MNKNHPYIISKSSNEMEEEYEYWRGRDIERAAREIQQLEEEEEENLWGAPARDRYS